MRDTDGLWFAGNGDININIITDERPNANCVWSIAAKDCGEHEHKPAVIICLAGADRFYMKTGSGAGSSLGM